jgi:CMP-N-acetylneuraminic acid synthetase
MIRRRVLKAVGGYDPRFGSQDGHEVWLRLLHRFKVAHLPTPLFSYRQHEGSMSTDTDALLVARRAIKRAVATRYDGPVKPRCAAIVPVKNTYAGMPDVALAPLAGRPLLDYTLDCVAACEDFSLTYVSTDDPRVVSHCAGRPATFAQLRDQRLSDPDVHLREIVQVAVDDMEQRLRFDPDIVAVLNVHAPLRRPEHVAEALDTLVMHEVDQVVSTYEDHELHFRHGRHGLEPLNADASRGLRLERQALFAWNGAVHVFWRDALRTLAPFEGRIGHIVMSRTDSIQAKHPEDRGRAEAVLLARRAAAAQEDRA